MSAQFEEVVVATDAFDFEHVGPDVRQGGFDFARRRLVATGSVRRCVWCRQRLAVQLAVRRARHGIERHERRGHHVLGQRRTQQRPHRALQVRRCLRRHHIGYQPRVLGRVHPRRDRDLAHRRMPRDRGFDLRRLDAEAADFHLLIGPPQAHEPPIRQPPRQVARAIQPGVGNEGARHEPLRRQLRAAPVAARDPVAPDVQLANQPRRDELAVSVEHVDLCIRDRLPDPHSTSDRRDPLDGRPDGRLRRTVHVPQLRAARQQRLRQLGRQRLAATQQLQPGRAAPPRRDEAAPRRRCRLHHRAAGLVHPRQQPLGIDRLLAARDHDAAPADQRQVQLQPRDVEGQGGHRKQGVGRRTARRALHREQEVDDRRVRDLHALGLPSRAGGVEHVGEMLGARAGWLIELLARDRGAVGIQPHHLLGPHRQ